MAEFGPQELTLNVVNSELINDLKGNGKGKDAEKRKIDINDTRQLPKMKKQKKDHQ